MPQIAPSILSADFSKIAEAVKIVEEAGADLLHIDIMDGHFVPNLTFGPQLVASLKEKTSLPLDVHLMVDNPQYFIPLFQDAGADWISIHLEASRHLNRDISSIKQAGCKAGLALNPASSIHLMNDIIKDLDFVLLMTVNPGSGAQEFIEASKTKISQLKNWIKGQNLNTLIEIDGGVKEINIKDLSELGVDIFVVGSEIFKAKDPKATVIRLKNKLSKQENE